MRNRFAGVLLFLFILLSATSSSASHCDTLPQKKNISNITLRNGTVLNGYIVSVNDSSIGFLPKEDWGKGISMYSRTIPAESIQEINKKFKKGITVGGGILTGVIAGAVTGFVIGLNQDCDDPDGRCDLVDKLFSTKSFRASLVLSGILGTGGGLIGLFSPKKSKAKFTINGRRENIKYNRNGLLFY